MMYPACTKKERGYLATPSFEIYMLLLSLYTDLATMSLIWICFNKLGFTLPMLLYLYVSV